MYTDKTGWQLDRKSRLPHRRIQPLRQRPGFQSDPRQAEAKRREPDDQHRRLARNLALAHDLAARIHNANARAFQ